MSTDVLAERYGTAPRARRWVVLALAGVLVVAFGGWLAWTIADQTRPQVTSQLETFDVEGQHSTNAVLVVSLASDDVAAQCRLRAFAEDHSVVGERVFTPDPARGDRQSIDIRTDREATSVESLGCTADGQAKPR